MPDANQLKIKNETKIGVLLASVLFVSVAALSAYFNQYSPSLLWSVILFLFLILLIGFDLDAYRLPDKLTIPLIILGLIYSFSCCKIPVLSLAGGLLGYGLIWLVRAYWINVKGFEGIGLGDAKLLAAAGTWLGLETVPIVLLCGSVLGILYYIAGSRQTNAIRSDKHIIPFGPSIALSFWSIWWFTNGGLIAPGI